MLEEVITMDDNMRNAWLDMISKVYTNLHNSDRVLKASNVSDKKRERLLGDNQSLSSVILWKDTRMFLKRPGLRSLNQQDHG